MPYKITYPKIESATNTISQKCYEKAKEIYGEKLQKEVEERLRLELHSIEINNFESIYLIASELSDYSNSIKISKCTEIEKKLKENDIYYFISNYEWFECDLSIHRTGMLERHIFKFYE